MLVIAVIFVIDWRVCAVLENHYVNIYILHRYLYYCIGKIILPLTVGWNMEKKNNSLNFFSIFNLLCPFKKWPMLGPLPASGLSKMSYKVYPSTCLPKKFSLHYYYAKNEKNLGKLRKKYPSPYLLPIIECPRHSHFLAFLVCATLHFNNYLLPSLFVANLYFCMTNFWKNLSHLLVLLRNKCTIFC